MTSGRQEMKREEGQTSFLDHTNRLKIAKNSILTLSRLRYGELGCLRPAHHMASWTALSRSLYGELGPLHPARHLVSWTT